jgi:diguanylate cyclase (GGDEF)-like protein
VVVPQYITLLKHVFKRSVFRGKSPQIQGPPVSLGLLLTLPFVIQVVGVVGTVGYLSYRHGQKTIENMAYALMDQVGQRVTQQLDHHLQSAHQFNQSQVAAIAAGAIAVEDLDNLHRYLILQHRQVDHLTTVLFGTPQGDFRLSHRVRPEDYGVATRLQPGELPFEAAISTAATPAINRTYGVNRAGQIGRYLETIENIDVRDRPWYRHTVATGQPGWIGPYQLGDTSLLTLNAHAPIYGDSGELLGVFAVNITLNHLGDLLADLAVGPSGEVMIVERSGLVVATSTGEGPYTISSSLDANGRTAPGQLTFERLRPTNLASPGLRQAYAYLQEISPDLNNLRSPQALHIPGQGDPYFVTVVPYSDAHGLDWLVVTVIPEADFTAEIQQNLRHTVVLCLLALGAAIASGGVIARWVTGPITRLTQASVTLAAGDLTQRLSTSTQIVEVRILSQAFNQMADQLRQLFDHQVSAEAARQSEARFQRLAAAVPGMIYTYSLHPDGTTGFDYVSSVSQSILELTSEQILADAQSVLAQIHPDDRSAHDAAVAHSSATLEPFTLGFRNITPSGQLKWLEASSQPLRHDDGSITWYGLLLDVSDRAQLEADRQLNVQKLAASEARFQKLAATLPGLLYSSLTRPDGSVQFIYGSPIAPELLEIEVKDAIADASTVFNLFHPEDRAEYVAVREHSVVTNQPFRHEWRIITPSGKMKWLQVNARHERLPNQDILWFGVVLDISDRKRAEAALHQATQQLEDRLADLHQRNQEMIWLGEMTDLLQSCVTVKEAYRVLPDLLKPMFPDCAGSIFALQPDSNQLKAMACWSHPLRSQVEFHLKDCWALRRGRLHVAHTGPKGLGCRHTIPADDPVITLCLPMLAQGEPSGLFYLSTTDPEALSQAKQQLARTVAEQVSLAIANLHLRETLKEQSIRDSLTGLFNRRHLEEALQIELALAQRCHHALSVVMVDVDHFKTLNDRYGHDAGDRVLQTVSQVLKGRMRQADIACRYGGEEFTLVLPHTTLAEAIASAEDLRQRISHLTLNYQGQPLGMITASFGVACFPTHGFQGPELLQAADQALYQAKANGRNQVMGPL